MNNLFAKIFLCVWLSHLLAAGLVYVLLTAQREGESDSFGPPQQGLHAYLPGTTLLSQGREAVAHFERDKNPGNLTQYLNELQTKSGLHTALFDAKGKRLLAHASEDAFTQQNGRDVADGLDTLAVQAARSGVVEFGSSPQGDAGASRIRAANGNVYVWAAFVSRGNIVPGGGPGEKAHSDGPGGPPLGGSHRGHGGPDGPWGPGGIWQSFEIARFTAILMAASIAAYGLAFYLTGPTLKLRRATQQFASGDLSTRVGRQMGNRRDELADLGRDFDLMAERIESMLSAERRLLGDISHELRSPLARIGVSLDLAFQNADEETRGFLTRIERESGRLNNLIGQLLTLTRLESIGPETRRTPIALADLIDGIAADADYEARSRQRSVHVAHSEECFVLGNVELLQSAIENVVRNATRYTGENSVVEIELHRAEVAGQAVISVRDFGPGVPNASLERIFDPFYRVADARDRASGGVGLGLSITERAVHFHSGTVKATNAPGGGMLIEISLPLSGS